MGTNIDNQGEIETIYIAVTLVPIARAVSTSSRIVSASIDLSDLGQAEQLLREALRNLEGEL